VGRASPHQDFTVLQKRRDKIINRRNLKVLVLGERGRKERLPGRFPPKEWEASPQSQGSFDPGRPGRHTSEEPLPGEKAWTRGGARENSKPSNPNANKKKKSHNPLKTGGNRKKPSQILRPPAWKGGKDTRGLIEVVSKCVFWASPGGEMQCILGETARYGERGKRNAKLRGGFIVQGECYAPTGRDNSRDAYPETEGEGGRSWGKKRFMQPISSKKRGCKPGKDERILLVTRAIKEPLLKGTSICKGKNSVFDFVPGVVSGRKGRSGRRGRERQGGGYLDDSRTQL